jgi:hypothetical protein
MKKPKSPADLDLEFLSFALSDTESGSELLRALHRATKGDPQVFRLTVSIARADWIREGKSERSLARVFLAAAVGSKA